MTIFDIVPATMAHAVAIHERVRAAEVREIQDSHGLSIDEYLLLDMRRSTSAWAWLVDGQVGCMFGVVVNNLMSGDSYPWFISTALVDEFSFNFAKSCKRLLPELLEAHPNMRGMVDARYQLSLRWLQWLGAEMKDAIPWGANNKPFIPFEMRRKHDNAGESK